MFIKLLVVVILTVALSLTPMSGFAVPLFVLAVIVAFVIESVRIVPQQSAWVVERLGKFHAVLEPGLSLIVPFFDRIAYKHSLKEVPLDVAEQICITRDNTQLAVDGIIYFQVVDARLASYGTSDYVLAISQLAQTTLRSEIGKMELDKTFESRDEINQKVVSVLDEAGFAKIQPGMTQDQVRRLIGPSIPDFTVRYPRTGQTSWTWLYCAPANFENYFDVYFDTSTGKVVKTGYHPVMLGREGIAPNCMSQVVLR